MERRPRLRHRCGAYRFAVEQTGMERGELLEIAIVALIVLELVLFLLGMTK